MPEFDQSHQSHYIFKLCDSLGTYLSKLTPSKYLGPQNASCCWSTGCARKFRNFAFLCMTLLRPFKQHSEPKKCIKGRPFHYATHGTFVCISEKAAQPTFYFQRCCKNARISFGWKHFLGQFFFLLRFLCNQNEILFEDIKAKAIIHQQLDLFFLIPSCHKIYFSYWSI